METLKDKSFDSAKGAKSSQDDSSRTAANSIVILAVYVMLVGLVSIWLYSLNWDPTASFTALLHFIDPTLNSAVVGGVCFVSGMATCFALIFVGLTGKGENGSDWLIVLVPSLPLIIFVIALVCSVVLRIVAFVANIPPFLADHVHWVCGTFAFYVVAIPATVAAGALAIAHNARRPGARQDPLYEPVLDGMPIYNDEVK